ncbi:MAG: hypothetical protein JXQ65_14590 [Candidatus Marinimicrobia bacterium]|nr:hypothetical protein [Candidatus Neomarinimicrobiota bacterium]
MKCLKIFITLSLVFTLLSAKNSTVDRTDCPKPTIAEIERINHLYADCLRDFENNPCENILMNIVRQKVLVPESNYDCLKKPLKTIMLKSKDQLLKDYAMVTYIVILTETPLHIGKDQLYVKDPGEFFGFVNTQLPKNLTINDIK